MGRQKYFDRDDLQLNFSTLFSKRKERPMKISIRMDSLSIYEKEGREGGRKEGREEGREGGRKKGMKEERRERRKEDTSVEIQLESHT